MGQHSLESITNRNLNLLSLGLKMIQRELNRYYQFLDFCFRKLHFSCSLRVIFYKQKEMVIAGVIMGCTSETDIITQWEKHYINQNFRNRHIWRVVSRALMGIVPFQCEWLTSIIVSNIFLHRHLREGNHFTGCHFHISEWMAALCKLN